MATALIAVPDGMQVVSEVAISEPISNLTPISKWVTTILLRSRGIPSQDNLMRRSSRGSDRFYLRIGGVEARALYQSHPRDLLPASMQVDDVRRETVKLVTLYRP
jgi:hypothetical protein